MIKHLGIDHKYVIALGMFALLLSGCSTTRYVTVPCVGKDQVLPSEPEKVGGKLTGRADEDTRILAGGLIRWQAYGTGLRRILDGCRSNETAQAYH
jgi:hypothetical protein